MKPDEPANQIIKTDKDFIKDITAASRFGVSPLLHLLLWSVFLFLVFAIAWANYATLDEVTRGEGKVIPSSQVQVIQNLEGGILAELLVSEGQKVSKGQTLAKLSDIRFSSESQESKLKYYELLTQIARLTAEVEEIPLSFPAEITRNAPGMVKSAQQLYDTRQRTLQSTLDVLDQQYRQRQQEVSEMKTKRNQLSTSYDLVKQELDMSEPLVAQGAFSEIELLRLKRTANDIQGDLNAMVFSIPRLESAIAEITQKKHQEKSRAGAEKKFGGHGLLMDTGELKAGNEEELKKATRLHTATHLLHAALRKVLDPPAGGEVQQAGSDITAERLRFDFTFPRKMTPEEIKQVEDMVNEAVQKDYKVTKEEMSYEDAVKSGAMAFFKLKYPNRVNVYTIGPESFDPELKTEGPVEGHNPSSSNFSGPPFSRELCGGPHVSHTGEIGHITITKEEAVSAGVRRIRAVVE